MNEDTNQQNSSDKGLSDRIEKKNDTIKQTGSTSDRILSGSGVSLHPRFYQKGSRQVRRAENSFCKRSYKVAFRKHDRVQEAKGTTKTFDERSIDQTNQDDDTLLVDEAMSPPQPVQYDLCSPMRSPSSISIMTEATDATVGSHKAGNSFSCQQCSEGVAYTQLTCLHLLCFSCSSMSVRCEVCSRFRTGSDYEFYVRRRSTDGKTFVGRPGLNSQERLFHILPKNCTTDYENLQVRQQRTRSESVLELAAYYTNGTFVLSSSTITILEDSLQRARRNLKIVKNQDTQWKLSLETEVFIMKLLNVSKNGRREIKSELIDRGEDFLCPTSKYEKCLDNYALSEAKMEVFTEIVEPDDDDFNENEINLVKIGSAKIVNIQKVIQQYLDKTSESIVLDGNFDNKLWLRVGADRGSGTTKLMISFANRPLSHVNSPFNWIVVGAYEGRDKYEELKKYFASLLSELSEIKTLKVHGTDVEVQIFLVSDLNAQAAIMGLKGPASRFPCANCTTSMDDIKIFEKNGVMRNDDDCIRFLNIGSESTKSNMSYSQEPLIPFDTSVVVPPQLHSYVSPVTEIFKTLEELTQLIERCKLTGEKVESIKIKLGTSHNWDKVKVITEKEEQLRKKACEQAEEWIKNNRQVEEISDEWPNICFPACIFRQRRKAATATIALCTICGRSDHRICSGVSESGKLQDYKCWKCCDWEEAQTKIGKMKEHTDEAGKEIKSKKKLLEAARSEATQDFRKMSDRLGVRVGAFHGRLLPGNHVRNFLRNRDEFFKSVETLTVETEIILQLRHLRELADSIDVLHRHGVSRFLGSSEIQEVQQASADLKRIMIRSNIRSGSPKYHCLIYEIPEFVQKWRTLGLVSEQGLEALHTHFETAMVRFKYLRENGIQIQKALICTNNRNITLLNHGCQRTLLEELPLLSRN